MTNFKYTFLAVVQTPMLDLSSNSYGSSLFLSGANGSLTCSISLTNSIILWMKNGNLVVNNSRVQVMTSQGSSTIEFTPLHTSDGGRYLCIATVMSGGSVLDVSGEIDLNVTSKRYTLTFKHVILEITVFFNGSV